MKSRLFWLGRSLKCFFKGHEDGVTSYDPVSGKRDLGFTCFRCGRPRLNNLEVMMLGVPPYALLINRLIYHHWAKVPRPGASSLQLRLGLVQHFEGCRYFVAVPGFPLVIECPLMLANIVVAQAKHFSHFLGPGIRAHPVPPFAISMIYHSLFVTRHIHLLYTEPLPPKAVQERCCRTAGIYCHH